MLENFPRESVPPLSGDDKRTWPAPASHDIKPPHMIQNCPTRCKTLCNPFPLCGFHKATSITSDSNGPVGNFYLALLLTVVVEE